jgi:hypothetical protein
VLNSVLCQYWSLQERRKVAKKITIVKRDGKRYAKVGRRLIKIVKGISERELVKWLVSYLVPKRKKRVKGVTKEKETKRYF